MVKHVRESFEALQHEIELEPVKRRSGSLELPHGNDASDSVILLQDRKQYVVSGGVRQKQTKSSTVKSDSIFRVNTSTRGGRALPFPS